MKKVASVDGPVVRKKKRHPEFRQVLSSQNNIFDRSGAAGAVQSEKADQRRKQENGKLILS